MRGVVLEAHDMAAVTVAHGFDVDVPQLDVLFVLGDTYITSDDPPLELLLGHVVDVRFSQVVLTRLLGAPVELLPSDELV